MAVCGLSKLEAVNEMLESNNQARMGALESSGAWPALTYGTGIASKAEYILDRMSRRIQTMGWPDNTDYFTTVTPIAVAFTVTLANTVLWVRGSGSSQARNLTMRGTGGATYLWDMDNRTSNFGTQTPIMVDQVLWLDFDNMQPRTKDIVVAAAATVFQRRTRGSPDMDAYLKEEAMIADLVADRIKMRFVAEPINPTPALAAVSQAQGRQQQ
jgi:hypothetical protein